MSHHFSPAPIGPLAHDVTGQVGAVASGAVSAVELVQAALARIGALDPELNAFTVVRGRQALAEAAQRDAAAEAGQGTGPLHGVPFAIKEENDVAGLVTTFGTDANRTPAVVDGHVTQRLRQAGAVIVGKTNMPEFGQWPYTESAVHGVTRNPWLLTHTPGGSSGGTAAAVASGMVAGAIGGDGGGSIRIPSACCGLFGLKPTRGRVSTAPHPDLWCALGTVGPLTRSVRDSALIYDVISGNQPSDRYRAPALETPLVDATDLTGPAGVLRLRVGWSTQPSALGVRPDAAHIRAVEETAALLESLGHEVFEIKPRYPDTTSSFLPQFFGGVRDEIAMVENPKRLQALTRQTGAVGAWARPGVVARALRSGEKVAAKVDERIFATCEVLLTPTIAHRPPEVGVLDGALVPTALIRSIPMIAYTALWNVTGHPAAAIPVGVGADGLPMSVQVVAPRGDEARLLSLAAQVEAAQPWSMPWAYPDGTGSAAASAPVAGA